MNSKKTTPSSSSSVIKSNNKNSSTTTTTSTKSNKVQIQKTPSKTIDQKSINSNKQVLKTTTAKTNTAKIQKELNTANKTNKKEDDEFDLDSLFDRVKSKRKERIKEKEEEIKKEQLKKIDSVKSNKKNAFEEDDFFDSRGLTIKERKYVDGIPVFTEEELKLDVPGSGGG
eukprot:gene626-776_t